MRIDNLYNMEVILKEIGRRIREYRIGLANSVKHQLHWCF